MFTGLIQQIGRVVEIRRGGDGLRLEVEVTTPFEDLAPGESISVDGVCLTVVEPKGTRFSVDVSPETAALTTIGIKRPGARVNLERALRLTDRVGGHLVSGHIDGMGRVVQVVRRSGFRDMAVEAPREVARYLVQKGSIAIDGVSLTIASVSGNVFRVALIPSTLSSTTLGDRREGDKVNIETDLLCKYIAAAVSGAKGDKAWNVG